MADELSTAPLSELVDLTLSSVDKKSKSGEQEVQLCNYMDVYSNSFINGNLNFMMATASEQEIARCSLAAGDVVITKDSETHDDIGVPALVREDIPDLVCGYHLAILRPKPSKVSGPYLYYALQAQDVQHQFHSFANGITRFGLRKSDIELVEIPSPPLKEQQDIAHVLGTLDDKIELNRRMNRTLEEMARAIFQDWFVDFAPTRAKIEDREPYLPSELWDLFPDRLVESELGEIPEGWEVKALDEIADFRNGLALQKYRPKEEEDRLPVVKIAQLRNGRADGAEWASTNIPSDSIIDDGDVVFSWSGSLIVRIWCGGRAALNQHLFKATSGEYPKWFHLSCIEGHLPDFQDIAADKATTMGHIKRDHLSDAKCVAPNRPILEAASDILDDLLAQQISANLQSRNLASQRDLLLPKLVSGELRVH